MSGLLWFSGITWETSVRVIGWTWVVLVVLIGVLVRLVASLFKNEDRP